MAARLSRSARKTKAVDPLLSDIGCSRSEECTWSGCSRAVPAEDGRNPGSGRWRHVHRLFLVDEETGQTRTHKVASTPDDPARAIVQGLLALAPREGLAFLAHGTTVATNALIQRRGGKVALVTTAGFRDLLEIGRQTRPKIYDLKADHPEPLVPREHRFEVTERIGPDGKVIVPLDDGDVARAIANVRDSGADCVAVCFLFAFLNPQHERRLGEAIRAALPHLAVSLSCDVQPEFREYERLSTTVLNAFLQPVAGRYMTRLEKSLAQHAVAAGIGISQSSGGLMSVKRAAEMPIRTALSGPAAGVVGAVAAGARAGHRDLVTFDMGGTSTDVALVSDGTPEIAFDRSVAGYPIRLPSIDIHTVGAGGGSVAHIGRDGLMRVGPMSTGADPGPACYGKGGREPTVSDANLVLGRLPEQLIGGGMHLDPALAEEAIAPLAKHLGLGIAGDGARHRAHRQCQHAAGDPGRIGRARPRSAHVHPDAVRGCRRIARRRDRTRTRDPPRPRAAGARYSLR